MSEIDYLLARLKNASDQLKNACDDVSREIVLSNMVFAGTKLLTLLKNGEWNDNRE